MNILMIDNYDSFTYNLVDEFRRAGCIVNIFRNSVPLEELSNHLERLSPRMAVLSPGPSAPREAGNCIPFIQRFHHRIAILGICLGHQCLVEAFGGRVDRAPLPVHGKKSQVTHDGSAVFTGIPSPFAAGRYHSLYGTVIPGNFRVTATAGDIPMAMEDESGRLTGLQFHPESILTAPGARILQNILGRLA